MEALRSNFQVIPISLGRPGAKIIHYSYFDNIYIVKRNVCTCMCAHLDATYTALDVYVRQPKHRTLCMLIPSSYTYKYYNAHANRFRRVRCVTARDVHGRRGCISKNVYTSAPPVFTYVARARSSCTFYDGLGDLHGSRFRGSCRAEVSAEKQLTTSWSSHNMRYYATERVHVDF